MTNPNIYLFGRSDGSEELPDFLNLTCDNRITAPYRKRAGITLVEHRISQKALEFSPPVRQHEGFVTGICSASTIFHNLSEVPWLPHIFTTSKDAHIAGFEGKIIKQPFQLDFIEVAGKEGEYPWGEDNKITIVLSRLTSNSPFTLHQLVEEVLPSNAQKLFTLAGDELTVSSRSPVRTLRAFYAHQPGGDVFCM